MTNWQAHLKTLTSAQLNAVIEGTNRLGSTPDEQLLVWNLAIDEETDRMNRRN